MDWKSSKKGWKPYANRNRRLHNAGFESYPDYLASDLWAEIRERVLDRDGRKCRFCGDAANQAHHGNYTNAALSGKSIDGIRSVCGSCHKFIEIKQDGSKSAFKSMRKRTKLLIALLERDGKFCGVDYFNRGKKQSRSTKKPVATAPF